MIKEQVITTVQLSLGFRYGKKTYCQNIGKSGYSFIKNDIIFMYLLCIYKKTITLSLFKIDTLNFTMYILKISTCPLKTYIIKATLLKTDSNTGVFL